MENAPVKNTLCMWFVTKGRRVTLPPIYSNSMYLAPQKSFVPCIFYPAQLLSLLSASNPTKNSIDFTIFHHHHHAILVKTLLFSLKWTTSAPTRNNNQQVLAGPILVHQIRIYCHLHQIFSRLFIIYGEVQLVTHSCSGIKQSKGCAQGGYKSKSDMGSSNPILFIFCEHNKSSTVIGKCQISLSSQFAHISWESKYNQINLISKSV